MQFRKMISIVMSAVITTASAAVFGGTPIMQKNTAVAAENSGLDFYDPEEIYNYPLYLKKVRELRTTGAYKSEKNGFFLCDLNNDEMPELFVTFDTDDGGILFAGTIYNNELVAFNELTGVGILRSIALYDNGYIRISSGTASIYGTSISKYNGGENLTNVISVSQDLDPKATNKYLKYIDSKSYSITETEYNSILDQYKAAAYTAYHIPMQTTVNNVIYDDHFDHYEAYALSSLSATTATIANTVNDKPVTRIGKSFLTESDVKTLSIPANVSSYYYSAFESDCLTAINVDSANPYYTSKDGVMYKKNMTSIAKFPTAKDASAYSFPQSVTEIESFAFAWCSGVKKIDIPQTVDTINDYAFFECTNLSSVTIRNPQCDIYDYWDDKTAATFCNSFDTVKGTTKYLGVICGYDYSTAKEYADNFEFTFVSLGAAPSSTTTATTTTTTTKITTTTTAATTTTTAKTTTAATTTAPKTTTTSGKTNDTTEYKLGDVNNDGKLNAVDASSILAAYVNISTNKPSGFTDAQMSAADADGNGVVNAVDASYVLSYYAYVSTTQSDVLPFAEYLTKL